MKKYCDLPLIVVWMLVFLVPQVSQAGSEIVVPEGTRIALQLNNNLSTKSNSEGDAFTAVVAMPVSVGDRMAIPKGSIVNGRISRITRPGRMKGKAVMTLLFQSINITGRGQLAINASLVNLPSADGKVRSEGKVEGAGSEKSDAAKVLMPGVLGGGIGGWVGGGKGAAIGAGTGVAIGIISTMATREKDLEIRRGSPMDISLDRSLTIPPEPENTARR